MQSEDAAWDLILSQLEIGAFFDNALRAQGATTDQAFDYTNGADQPHIDHYNPGPEPFSLIDQEMDTQGTAIDLETPLSSVGIDNLVPICTYNTQPEILLNHRVDTRKWDIDLPSLLDCLAHPMQSNTRSQLREISSGSEAPIDDISSSNATEDNAFVRQYNFHFSNPNGIYANAASTNSYPQNSIPVASTSTPGNNLCTATAYNPHISGASTVEAHMLEFSLPNSSFKHIPTPQGTLTLVNDHTAFDDVHVFDSLQIPSSSTLPQLRPSSETILRRTERLTSTPYRTTNRPKIPCTHIGCEKTFHDKKTRKRHIGSVHLRERYFCPGGCRNNGFCREDNLKHHLDWCKEDSKCYIEAKKLGWDKDVKASVLRLRGYVPECEE